MVAGWRVEVEEEERVDDEVVGVVVSVMSTVLIDVEVPVVTNTVCVGSAPVPESMVLNAAADELGSITIVGTWSASGQP